MRFTGKTVIVTGASSGIGEAVAKRFLSEGANVVICSRSRKDLEKAFKGQPKGKWRAVEADVSREDDVKGLIDAAVKQFRRIDVLVNNAGVYLQKTVTETTYDEWKHLLSINLDGVFLCSHYALPHLKKSKGCIINTSSLSGLGGDEQAACYNASKGAVTNLTRAMAIDHGPDGVRVNAVCPTLTHTDLTRDMLKDKKLVKEFNRRIPLGRYGEPEDLAGAYAFLASDDARFITGVNLPVDGGAHASNGQPIYTD